MAEPGVGPNGRDSEERGGRVDPMASSAAGVAVLSTHSGQVTVWSRRM